MKFHVELETGQVIIECPHAFDGHVLCEACKEKAEKILATMQKYFEEHEVVDQRLKDMGYLNEEKDGKK